MEPKKNIVITFRVNEETKKKIDKIAKEKDWSISKVIEKICQAYFLEKENNNGI